ncbi:uncharacterized protein LOC109832246 [Asparagus officinalis]|uniref:uncharacterized protein LOC109832246 n=1 Tax=Asparagus officinalis TaxID=4686 RepID=UPI00098E63CB|nr:uncharacterized protein LOC109832246 [Asparagus officinalis]
MVSLQASLRQGERKTSLDDQEKIALLSSKKRKWGGGGGGESERDQELAKELKLCKKEQDDDDVELNLDAPLPLEWERCLDIKSGQIHFYNTRTHKRTSKDPRSSPRPSLDLELNLNLTNQVDQQVRTEHEPSNETDRQLIKRKDDNSGRPSSPSPSWISFDTDRQEMVAAVCVRCHMLVMMCKATPSCPNCKFVHPQGQSSTSFHEISKPLGFRLLCCKD